MAKRTRPNLFRTLLKHPKFLIGYALKNHPKKDGSPNISAAINEILDEKKRSLTKHEDLRYLDAANKFLEGRKNGKES